MVKYGQKSFMDIQNIKEIINLNTRSTSGVWKSGDICLFYKILKKSDYAREISGYENIQDFYPVPELLLKYKTNNTGLLVFEYEKSIGLNQGLLSDVYVKYGNHYKIAQKNVINMYKNSFLRTLKKTKSNSSTIFFEDRVPTRLKKFYPDSFWNQYNNFHLKLNDKEITLTIRHIQSSIINFFNNNKKRNNWSVISQCDPGDLNIGIKPIIFDYLAGGYNPIMAEFAAFFWYNLAQNSYFSPIYNKITFQNHPNVLSNLDLVNMDHNRLTHKIDRRRKLFIEKYIDNILEPIFLKINDYPDWYEHFKNYLAMRILCVFDLAQMPTKDVVLSLAYLDFFYNKNISTLSDLKKSLYEIHP